MRGFEPPTLGTTIRCSNQLSYTHRTSADLDQQSMPKFISQLRPGQRLKTNKRGCKTPHFRPDTLTWTRLMRLRFAPSQLATPQLF